MANSVSARKSARQSDSRRKHNQTQRTNYRTAVKSVRKAIEVGDKDAALKAFKEAQATIDKLADKRIVHANKAARHKSRLVSAIKAL